jgi:NADH dehydrogenase (ubiquinone) Fe-S protein 1
MPAMPGSKVFTNTPLVHKAREGVMEFLLANHPLDCPICDQGGECDLQDQSMRYGSDRTRFHEITGKCAVENKDLGPIVKTSMNRCIQCTRCVRFANDVAGVEDLGTSGRGNDLQIGMYIEKTMDSEMSGNIIDLCPVGALTSKPYAFQARPWELKKTESVDVLDAVGSNIRIDSRGVQVMRIQPKINDEINEEWINDKTRYAYDGLRYQRLTTPLVREGDKFVPATWEHALETIRIGYQNSGAQGDEVKAVAGHLADTESLIALKDLVNRLGSENLTLDQPSGDAPPVTGVDVRSNYLFNTGIENIEDADAVLLIGTNPRHEAAIINARFRQSFLQRGAEFALIGEKFDSIFAYDHLGTSAKDVADFLGGKGKGSGKGEFAKVWKEAKKPMIIVGSAVTEGKDGAAVLKAVSQHVLKNEGKFLTPDWNGFSILQRVSVVRVLGDLELRVSSRAHSRRRHLGQLRMTSASPHPLPPPRSSPSSSTCSTPTRSNLRRSPRTRSSSTRATTATSARSLPTSACPARRTPKRPQRGSTPRVGLRMDGSPFPRPERVGMTGRLSGEQVFPVSIMPGDTFPVCIRLTSPQCSFRGHWQPPAIRRRAPTP